MTITDAFSNLMILECSNSTGSPPWGMEQKYFSGWLLGKGLEDISVNTASREMAILFCEQEYWDPMLCAEIPSPLDFVVLQAGYNCGQTNGILFLQKALGVTEDGLIGPVTLHAAINSPVSETIKGFLSFQNSYYKKIENPSNEGWEGGWHKRVARTAKIVGVAL